MKKNLLLIKILAVYLLMFSNTVAAQTDHLKEGIELFNKSEFDKSKILFEKNIVYNPKSEKSYLYLAKIFKNKNNDEEQEIKINN